MIKQLFTNADGRLSTTTTIQFLGFLVLAGTFIFAMIEDRSYAPDLFVYIATYCGGLTVTKGAVSAYRDVKSRDN